MKLKSKMDLILHRLYTEKEEFPTIDGTLP